MKNRMLWAKFILIIFMFLMTSCNRDNTTYTELKNHTITDVDVKNDKVIIEGYLHGSLVVVYDYSCKVEDDAMYIQIHLGYPSKSREGTGYTHIEFEQTLSADIEKIFIEDEKVKIMIWEKKQGYDAFNIEDKWNTELQKLK